MPAIIQQGKNAVVYQVQPLKIVLPAATRAGSKLLVIIEAQKSGDPFDNVSLASHTLAPVVSDDKNNTYTQVNRIVNLSQEVGSSPPLTQTDASGFFPSVFAFTTAATTGTQTISIAAFYDDQYHAVAVLSPPQVGGRAVYDGGLQVQVYELSSSTIGGNATVSGNSLTLGAAAAGVTGTLVFEVLILMDSSAFSPATGGTIVDSGVFLGGSSYWAVQTNTSGAAIGFKNPLQYPGGVLGIGIS